MNSQPDTLELSGDIRGEIFGRVAVLMGGDSAEREISLKSGAAALEALKRKGVDAFGLDLRFNNAEGSNSAKGSNSADGSNNADGSNSADGSNNADGSNKAKGSGSICQQLSANKFDIAFIALHGRGGEDGVIQGVLEALGIPYSGCKVAASAIAMDKLRTKLLWSGADLPTPGFELIKASEILADDKQLIEQLLAKIEISLGFPVIVKPAHEGSSIGMNKADDRASLVAALNVAAKYDNEILVEKWIVGKEYTGAVLNGQVLPLIRLETPREFYDFQAKYITDDTLYHCPSGLDTDLENQYQALVLKAFELIGAEGWGRVDFMCDEQGQPWLIEINTVPGLTDHSLVPMAARNQGIEFDELIVKILNTANVHGR